MNIHVSHVSESLKETINIYPSMLECLLIPGLKCFYSVSRSPDHFNFCLTNIKISLSLKWAKYKKEKSMNIQDIFAMRKLGTKM